MAKKVAKKKTAPKAPAPKKKTEKDVAKANDEAIKVLKKPEVPSFEDIISSKAAGTPIVTSNPFKVDDEKGSQGSLFAEDPDEPNEMEELRGDMDSLGTSGDSDSFEESEDEDSEDEDLFDDPELNPFDDLDEDNDYDEDDEGSYF